MTKLHWLEGDVARIALNGGNGAQVVHLIDRRSQRDWLAPADHRYHGVADRFDGAAGHGWDECFPTIAAPVGHDPIWGRSMRDHGDLWGRPWTIEHGDSCLDARFAGDGFLFHRRLSLTGETILASYSVVSRSDRPIDYVWSQHCLLAMHPSDRLDLTGVPKLHSSYGVVGDRPIPPQSWPWPDGPSAFPRLDVVPDTATPVAIKLHGAVDRRCRATLTGQRGSISIEWDAADIPVCGLWLNHGGWPEPPGLHHIAVEPTTAPMDALNEARALGAARVLAPGEQHGWTIRITLGRE